MNNKSLFVVLLLIIVARLWASDIEVDGIWYDFDNNSMTASVTFRGSSYNDYRDEYAGDVTIPSSVTYDGKTYSVTRIGEWAFFNCKTLTSVIVPESVTSIGRSAFENCTELSSVSIPNSVTSIGVAAFWSCYELTTVTIPNGVTSIEGQTFQYCHNLNSVTIGNNITSIGNYAFCSCSSLTSIAIPNSVTSIGDRAFLNSGLNSIYIPNSVTNIGEYAFSCNGIKSSVTIPNSVTSIGEGAFSNVPHITYSGSATGAPWGARCMNGYIDGYFVYGDETKIELYVCFASITGEVTVPESVTAIKDGAFYGCSGLTSVVIPNNITSIGDCVFYGCSGLTSPVYSTHVFAFMPPSYSGTYTIPDGITRVAGGAFYNCETLTSINIPNSVTSIGSFAFYGCKGLTSIVLPQNVTSIENNTFYGCSGLTNVEIPNKVTSIGGYAFANCSALSEINIPNSVTSIGWSAFERCKSLTSIIFPNSITRVEENVFKDSGLQSPVYNAHVFAYMPPLCPFPFEQAIEYTIPDGIETIAGGAFVNCWQMASVVIPNSVTDIGDFAFSSCRNLTSVSMGNSVINIGGYAFYDCYKLISITVPNSVTSIGAQCFNNCSGLTSVAIGNGVTSIGVFAFASCSSLASVICEGSIPASLGGNVFLNDTSSSSIIVPCGSLDSYKEAWNGYAEYIKYKPLDLSNISMRSQDEDKGTVVSQSLCEGLRAIPNYGYQFVQWSDGNTDNPRIIDPAIEATYIAEFAIAKSGLCGDDNLLTWVFDDESKTLTIIGKGALGSNYTFGLDAPTQTERLIIEEGVTSVGQEAFKNMATITSVAFPSSLTTIGNYAFAGLNNRKFNTLVLPNTIISIGAHAFDGASYLQTIHFGSVLEEIGDYAFNGCTRVKEMTCLAEITPNVGVNGLTSISSLATLNVPNDYLFDYQIDNNWNRFQLQALGATEATVTDNDVQVVADDNTATITWPTDDSADSYTIEITKDGVVFCLLTFNANGQLTGIAFAPSRDGQAGAPSATKVANGSQFTVTGLNSGTNYGYLIETKSGSTTVASYSGEFETTGAPEVATGIDDVESSANNSVHKLLHDGQLLILRNGNTYTATGVKVE